MGAEFNEEGYGRSSPRDTALLSTDSPGVADEERGQTDSYDGHLSREELTLGSEENTGLLSSSSAGVSLISREATVGVCLEPEGSIVKFARLLVQEPSQKPEATKDPHSRRRRRKKTEEKAVGKGS